MTLDTVCETNGGTILRTWNEFKSAQAKELGQKYQLAVNQIADLSDNRWNYTLSCANRATPPSWTEFAIREGVAKTIKTLDSMAILDYELTFRDALALEFSKEYFERIFDASEEAKAFKKNMYFTYGKRSAFATNHERNWRIAHQNEWLANFLREKQFVDEDAKTGKIDKEIEKITNSIPCRPLPKDACQECKSLPQRQNARDVYKN